ncbi:fused ferrous iron transporter, protein B: GTP-binding protein; membrane protein [uncultured Alphaproteobacteria bacterium]|uniref:Ferrous iron transport protein B n=1 Tax=uncultured Alphaproteobacteria bacterium TaxID=91750 RepID=A0A212KH56_9PROT|nr:fused ferrous iron transporter, protein B: GTP-binding protein; membrane protein [uncultured Alphaproteobacteria bacterium]
MDAKRNAVVAVVGNPNCGKTTLFNALTGARQAVGNWAGVTVEKKVGRAAHAGLALEIVDLPGTYCLSFGDAASEDERIARDYVASGEADAILNIVDASNLERNLYVTLQLIEMRVPMVVALNMMDAAETAGVEIDVAKLSERLGCPVVPMVASRGKGVREVLDALAATIRDPAPAAARVTYPDTVERAVSAAEALPGLVRADARGSNADRRFAALRAIEDIEGAAATLPPQSYGELEKIVAAAEAELGDTLDILLADGRYAFIGDIAADAVRQKGVATAALTQRIDRVVLHRVFGLPIFLGVMYAMFLFTINVGGAFIDFFDQFFATLFVDGFGHLLASIGAPDWAVALLAKGVGGGIQTVATFVPVIGCLFLFLSFLEDSGYMARAAFVMDRVMRAIGLPGKAFVPLIVGFGCSVPAVMAARTLENPRDRILTALMAPFMSCGARLPVYVLFAAAFFPASGQNVVFALYLIGIAAAIGTGFMLKSTLLRGDTAPFIMELPPYHLPQTFSLLLRAWDRLKVFILRAGKMIVSVVVVLSFLNSWGTDGSFGNEDSDQSVLSAIGRTVVPVLSPMGVREDNWPAAVGMFTGIFAKEAVIGTLNALYAGVGDAAAEDDGAAAPEAEESFDLWGGLAGAFATIPENLAGVVDQLADPLGIEVGDLSDSAAVAEENEVDMATFGAMQTLFGSQAAAFAYLLAVLLYMPCVAAMGAIYRETGAGWATFAALWTTGLGYGAATAFYQAATFSEHPGSSAIAIGCVAAALIAAVATLRHLGAPAAGSTVEALRHAE